MLHDYARFEESAMFVKIICDWFNTMNVKSNDFGFRKRDARRNAIHRKTVDEDLIYIQVC